jgi:hypothetical protein
MSGSSFEQKLAVQLRKCKKLDSIFWLKHTCRIAEQIGANWMTLAEKLDIPKEKVKSRCPVPTPCCRILVCLIRERATPINKLLEACKGAQLYSLHDFINALKEQNPEAESFNHDFWLASNSNISERIGVKWMELGRQLDIDDCKITSQNCWEPQTFAAQCFVDLLRERAKTVEEFKLACMDSQLFDLYSYVDGCEKEIVEEVKKIVRQSK